MKFRIKPGLCYALAVLLASTTLAHAAPATVAAEVNNDKIMMAEVQRKLDVLKEQEPALAMDTAEARTALENLRQAIVDEMITNQLIYQEAQKRRITPDQEAVDTLLAEFKAQFRDEAEMQKDLKRQGKSLADLRTMIVTKLLVDELTEQWLADVVVTDEDISKYYKENQEKFKTPEGVRVRHILVEVKPGASADDAKKAETRAQSLLTRVQAKNADFGEIARAHSDDPSSRNDGGDLGVLTPDANLLEPLKKAIFAAAVGKPVQVKSDFGYHIIKVEEKIAPRMLSLAEVKNNPNFPYLKANLLAQKRDARYDEQVEALRAKAKIKKHI